MLEKALSTATKDSVRFNINDSLSLYYLEKDRTAALPFIENCIELAKKNKKILNEAYGYSQKGYAFRHLNKLRQAYQYLDAARQIMENPKSEENFWQFEKNTTPHRARLTMLSGLYIKFYLLKKIGQNEADYLKDLYLARKYSEEVGYYVGLGQVVKFEALEFVEKGKWDSTLIKSDEALKIFGKIQETSANSEIYMYKARALIAGKMYKAAVESLHTAIYWAYDDNDLDDVSKSYGLLAELFTGGWQQPDSAFLYAAKQLSVLQEMNSDRTDLAYYNLSRSYRLLKKPDSVYKYDQLAYTGTVDYLQGRIKGLSEFQQSFFEDQLRVQKSQAEKTERANKIKLYSLVGGLLFLCSIGVFLYRNNRQKQETNKKLEATLTDLRSTQAQLIQSEKMASLGELTAGIAHEIQNPLNFVNNFSEVSNELIDEMNAELDKGDIDEAKLIAVDVKQNLEKITHHGKRAGDIVKGMLQHSRSSSGVKELTDINALADEYLRLAFHGLRAKDKTFNATLKTDFDETIGNINIIPQDIGRVILNLITNAFYAVDERKKQQPENLPTGQAGYEPNVSVSTKKINDGLEIKVTDNGNGIPQNIIDKIFQPFFTTKPTGQGTGLGLSLAYDIVKAHGGELKVETKEGEGSAFSIIFNNNI